MDWASETVSRPQLSTLFYNSCLAHGVFIALEQGLRQRPHPHQIHMCSSFRYWFPPMAPKASGALLESHICWASELDIWKCDLCRHIFHPILILDGKRPQFQRPVSLGEGGQTQKQRHSKKKGMQRKRRGLGWCGHKPRDAQTAGKHQTLGRGRGRSHGSSERHRVIPWLLSRAKKE